MAFDRRGCGSLVDGVVHASGWAAEDNADAFFVAADYLGGHLAERNLSAKRRARVDFDRSAGQRNVEDRAGLCRAIFVNHQGWRVLLDPKRRPAVEALAADALLLIVQRNG
ncbi:MAG: hypothetical protein WD076_11515 [Parvularculaceae bacterium]